MIVERSKTETEKISPVQSLMTVHLEVRSNGTQTLINLRLRGYHM